jgi:hypothetical protein
MSSQKVQKIFIRLTEIINLFMPPGYIQEYNYEVGFIAFL